jgi:hypothetical protein
MDKTDKLILLGTAQICSLITLWGIYIKEENNVFMRLPFFGIRYKDFLYNVATFSSIVIIATNGFCMMKMKKYQ